MLNVASDLDFNLEGEIKYPLLPGLNLKTNFTVYFHAMMKIKFMTNLYYSYYAAR